MFRKLLIGTAVACALTFGGSVGASAQEADAQKAKKEAKEAGKDAK